MDEIKVTNKRKGRPSLKDKPSEITIIKDPLMEPFYISKDNYGYTIFEKVTPESNISYAQTHGHYSSFGNALNGVAVLKVNKKYEYNSILEYVNEFKKIKQEITKLLNLGI
jgi:transposase